MSKAKRSEFNEAQFEAVRRLIQKRADWLKDDLNRVLDQTKERESDYIGAIRDGELLVLSVMSDVLCDRLEAEHGKPYDPEEDDARDLAIRLHHRVSDILGFHKRRVPKR